MQRCQRLQRKWREKEALMTLLKGCGDRGRCKSSFSGLGAENSSAQNHHFRKLLGLMRGSQELEKFNKTRRAAFRYF